MKTQLTYLAILLGSFIFPFFIGFLPSVRYYKNLKNLFLSFSITAFLFVIWDSIFTAVGVWGFNEHYIIGLRFFNLPVEEVLFFFVIPFCCLLIYESLFQHFNIRFKTTVLSYALALVSFVIACIFYQRLYTLFTFSLATLLFIFIGRKNYSFLPTFFVMFLISMIPFLIVNGLLTGTYIEQPVVWYNNMENSTYRLLTIPYEDIFYGLDLLLINTILYEHFKKSSALLRPTNKTT